MYRVGVEAILGLTAKNGALRIDPCIPRNWSEYEADLRTTNAEFHIVVKNPDGVNRGVRSVEVDGKTAAYGIVPMNQMTGRHDIKVILG
jgi:cellobiose phosphorylase